MATFEKYSILFKVKEGENSNPSDFHRDSQEYLEYFEDENLSLTTKLGKRGRFSKVSNGQSTNMSCASAERRSGSRGATKCLGVHSCDC